MAMLMKWFHSYIGKFWGGKSVTQELPLNEVFWSAAGAFLGIFAVYEIGRFDQFHIEGSLFLVGSFGASVVLIYGVPKVRMHSPEIWC